MALDEVERQSLCSNAAATCHLPPVTQEPGEFPSYDLEVLEGLGTSR